MDDRRILNIKFNQDNSCFTSAMECGLVIYNTEPLEELAHYRLDTMGSVSHCEMLFKSNIIALVSGGSDAKYPNNIVHLFDCETDKLITEFKFSSGVKNIRLTQERLVVILRSHIHIFSFPSPIKKLLTIDTPDNSLGLCCLSSDHLLVCPGQALGSINAINTSMIDIQCMSHRKKATAHKSELSCISMSQDGTMIATASRKGTLIRVWNAHTLTRITEFRRGTDVATIYSISFSHFSDYLCVSSDKGTLHIFGIKNQAKNRRISMNLSGLPLLGEYSESQWGLTKTTLGGDHMTVCAFNKEDEVIALTYDGTYRKYMFVNETRACILKNHCMFLDACNETGL